MRTKTIGLIAHAEKPGVANLARDVIREFTARSHPVIVENGTAKIAKAKAGGTIAQVAKRSDLIVVLGGDGTILHVVNMAGKNLKPIFGINVGSLGFLTCVNSSAYREAVDAISSGRISYSKRSLLSVELRTNKRALSSVHALNDAVISRGDLSRLIKLDAKVNGEALTEFNADGLIIATPTGSTAYSLSAGGPILSPESGVFVITPICPHVLTNRSIIISDSSVVEISPGSTEYPCFLSVDGREPVRVPGNARVAIRRAKVTLQLGFLPEISFFSVLRHKLKWTGSNV
jgi:NAD+ kinase